MTQELTPGTVYVCQERDIECGDFERNWCKRCPKRRTESPSPASDAASEAAFATWWTTRTPAADRAPCTFMDLNSARAAFFAARAASTRTASDTRTAAGEAECDAALQPESSAEVDVEAERKLFEAWASSQNWIIDRNSFGEYQYSTARDGWDCWLAARTQADAGKDKARLNALIDWYLREGKRSEIHPNGHIEHTSRERIIAWCDKQSTTTKPENT